MKNIIKNNEDDRLPYLSEEVIFQILKRVPAKYLKYKCRYVCKAWYNLISSSDFIAAQSTPENRSGLLVVVPTKKDNHGNVVRYQAKLLEIDVRELEFKTSNVPIRRIGKIRSSCNGLIVVDDRKQRGLLHVMNMLEGCCLTLPKCPSGCKHKDCGAALGFDPGKKEYKVVHIYSDGYGFEIFTLGCSDSSWKRIPGPFKKAYERPFDIGKFKWSDPVSINGQVLHWYVASDKYIISMSISDEKFSKTYLPDCGERKLGCRYLLLDIGGNLGLVYTVSDTQIDIWILKDLDGQNWIKRHSVVAESISYMDLYSPLPNFRYLSAVAALRDGEAIMFKRENENNVSECSYLYDINKRVLKKFKMKIKCDSNFIPHGDSLIRWKNEGDLFGKNYMY